MSSLLDYVDGARNELLLVNMSLQKLTADMVPPGVERIRVSRCKFLSEIDVSGVARLTSLSVSFCPSLVALAGGCPPNLEDLELECCQKLESVWSEMAPSVSDLYISLCENIKTKVRVPNPCASLCFDMSIQNLVDF
jgi:hypothetical protein